MSNKKRVSIDFPIEIYEKLEKQADLAGLKVPTFIRSTQEERRKIRDEEVSCYLC